MRAPAAAAAARKATFTCVCCAYDRFIILACDGLWDIIESQVLGLGSVSCGLGSVPCGLGSVSCGLGSVSCAFALARATIII